MVPQGYFKLIRGGEVYAPEHVGAKDVLMAGERIVSIKEDLEVPRSLGVQVMDASGCTVVPGLIDPHVHVLGGGGEGGPTTRVPPISLTDITLAGVTTVVGVLGTDNVTRSIEALLAKTKGLRLEGVSSYMYTGSFHYPPSTVTGSVKRDIALIEEVIGVKTAVSDHRDSQMSVQELARLSSDARFGGMLGGKTGIVHVHLGGGPDGLGPVNEVIRRGNIPVTQFLPTHVNRSPELLEQGMDLVRRGGAIDLNPGEEEGDTLSDVETLRDGGVDLTRVTFSSDGNGTLCRFSEDGELVGYGVGKVSTLMDALRAIVASGTLPLTEALRLFGGNAADVLGLPGKGRVGEGMDADILVLDGDMNVSKVFSRGRLMVDEGRAVAKGTFEP
jgi:beta-aspartyl-dipeptidase (metallo-type)